MENEYAAYGGGYVKRTAGSDEEWQSCTLADIPMEWFDEQVKVERRRRLGYDPERQVPFARIIRGG